MASAIDEDTVKSVQSGRATIGAMLRSAQTHLQKVFIVFVVGMIGTIMALQYGLWTMIQQDLVFSSLEADVLSETSIVSTQAFEVILLQVKIGAVVGGLVSLPLLIYFGRDGLRERGWWPTEHIPAWKGAAFVVVSLSLFAGGVVYAYELFFPLMFEFLAGNAVSADFTPQYSIVKWFQFVFLLAVSFGLAAQLPLVMSVLSYTEIVPYETFRDKWRYAVMAIFGFGALFSPPDPFTQIMWALPLCGLYAVSLGLAKLSMLLRRSSDLVSTRSVARDNWNTVLGAGVLSGGLVYYLLATEAFASIRSLVALAAPYSERLSADVAPPALFGLSVTGTALIFAALVGLAGAVVALYVHVLRALSANAAEGRHGDPTAIDVDELNAAAVEVAPPEVFEEMSEEEALAHADRALADDDQQKAEMILERWDMAHEDDEAADDGEGDATEGGEEESDVVASTTAGMMSAFTEEEKTEDDIGGYYYDIQFILSSLASKAFWILGVFGAVLAGTFLFLYKGGIGTVANTFLRRLSTQEQVARFNIVTLGPVEHLVFIVKFSTILGAIAVLPMILYFAWPAMRERGLVVGNRNVLALWGGTVFGTLVGGSLFGFLYVAPRIISWIAQDQLQSHMIISYQISNFGWLVFFLTIGIGILAEIPVTMVLFHTGGIVPFEAMYRRWREVVIAIVAASAIFSPSGIFTMFIVGIPTALAYLLGIAILWVYTLGGRRTPDRSGEPAD